MACVTRLWLGFNFKDGKTEQFIGSHKWGNAPHPSLKLPLVILMNDF